MVVISEYLNILPHLPRFHEQHLKFIIENRMEIKQFYPELTEEKWEEFLQNFVVKTEKIGDVKTNYSLSVFNIY